MQSKIQRSLYLVALGHLTIELCNNYLPVLYPLVMPKMGLNFTQIGLIALVATTAMALAQPFFGYVSDRWGAERLSALSIVWIGVAMGLVGFAKSYPSLLGLIALGSFGSAAFHPPSAVIAAANSGSRRGAGISIFSVGGNIGSALSPLWLTLAFAWFGLRGTTVLIPIGLILGPVMYWELRRARHTTPLQQSSAPRPPVATKGYLLALILVVAAMMFRSWVQVAFASYLPIWITDTGGSVAAGGRMLAIFMFSISAGSLVGGSAGDRFGHWQTIAVSMVALPTALALFINSAGLMQGVSLIVAGISIGATYPTSIVMALEAWPHQVGVASGLLMGLGWWPGGLGASFTGYIADRFSLHAGLQTLIVPPLMTIVCILAYAVFTRSRPTAVGGVLES